jgi:putative endonuclease
MLTSKQQLGVHGEDQVAQYLIGQGFTILARNYQKQYGELDLVAIKGDTLAFVEVKTRTYRLFEAMTMVPIAKQKKIIKTAYAFIAEHALIDTVYRFDIALIYNSYGMLEIEYIPDAFTDERG